MNGILPVDEFNFQIIAIQTIQFPLVIFVQNDLDVLGLQNFVQRIRKRTEDLIFIINTDVEFTNLKIPWQLINIGVCDVLCIKQKLVFKKIASKLKRHQSVLEILNSPTIDTKIIGKSDKLRSLLYRLIEIGMYSKSSTLIMGENGTGKEEMAKLIHEADNRPNKGEFVISDCASIVPELSGSEFFGHERGAFTNAIQSREGFFSQAHNGTLFLDEIGELPLRLQGELLRVTQEGLYKKVGGNQWKRTSFRLICATNRNIEKLIRAGKFRKDLYYRITTNTIKVPPLSERSEDIALLIRHFVKSALKTDQKIELEKNLLSFLIAREYPGNIRELKHLVARIMIHYPGEGPLTIGDLPTEDVLGNEYYEEGFNSNLRLSSLINKAISKGMNLKEIKEITASIAIEVVLDQVKGNISKAAKKLGVTNRTLQLRANKKKMLTSLK